VIGTEVKGTLGAGEGGADTIDYYEVVAPPGDPSGGYFQGAVTNVGNGVVFADIYSTVDNGRLLLADGASVGESTFFYWAGRPGQHYQVRLYEGSGVAPTFDYTLKVTYTKIDDRFEPNDTSDAPASLVAGTPTTAYFFSGFNSAQSPTPDQDWYAVTLNPGAVTVGINPAPHDVRMQFLVYDAATFVQVSATGNVAPNPGAAITTGAFTSAGGQYLIQIQAFAFAVTSVAGRGSVPPDSFLHAYTLTVSQP
jgi:hypothetical protein